MGMSYTDQLGMIMQQKNHFQNKRRELNSISGGDSTRGNYDGGPISSYRSNREFFAKRKLDEDEWTGMGGESANSDFNGGSNAKDGW